MRPRIEEAKARKYPFRVMVFSYRRNIYKVYDCHRTRERAEGQLKRILREINNGTFEGIK